MSIGSTTFLIQNTDFIYEYLSLFLKTVRLKVLEKFFKFDEYEQNEEMFENYMMFLGATLGVKKNIIGFLARLATCFLCLNCFFSILMCLFLFECFMYYALPCFVFSVLTYYALFSIKKRIFE